MTETYDIWDDITTDAVNQAREDHAAASPEFWKKTPGPGMPFSNIRKIWDKAYAAECQIIYREK
jgi:hypothetical protein